MRALLLVAAAALPASAQVWEFPHSTHLVLGLDCRTCHEEAYASQSATDALLPAVDRCAACHNGQVAPALDLSALEGRQNAVRSYRFNHAFHLELGNVAPLIAAAIDSGNYFGKLGDARRFLDGDNACTACHRGLEESLSLDSSAHLPSMGDCIVCHTKVDNPFTCKECHLPDTDLLPEDHTREFVDQHSTGRLNLDKQSCLPCHGRNFACMGCH